MLLLTAFLALASADRAASPVAPPRPRIEGRLAAGKPTVSPERLIFNAKRSTTFVEELRSFLSLLAEHNTDVQQIADPYRHLLETFSDTASKEGVADTRSGNPVGLAYDWINQGEWKYFVRLEVDFAAFHALFESAKEDPLYRDVAVACLIYGGQGILDFKRNVPDYIDSIHQRQEFQTVKFDPRNKKQARWVYRLAGQEVDLQLARYRAAFAYFRSRGIDADTLQKKSEAEQQPALRGILQHYGELVRAEAKSVEVRNDFQFRLALLLSDVARESPELVTAVLRIGEKNKHVVLDGKTGAFDAEPTAFAFLMERQD